ncbi:MAG: alanine racemase [Lachnospiraceae bacterium]|nr:alanine racemase [Lachnospiraceae bacterium]MDE7331732.1 alanine racemase [Lachnospiraceae bacterium]
MEEYQRVWAEIDLDAVRSNMESMKANISPNTTIIGVIKTDGYGHGAVPIAKELEGLDYLYGYATATAEEAFILRKAGIRKPLLVLGYTFPYCYERMIQEEVRMTVFRHDTLKELSLAAGSLKEKGIDKKAKVHIKVDTGMSRIGIKPGGEGVSFIKEAFGTKGIEVEGIFTHFARADEEDKTPVNGQLTVFSQFLERIKEETGEEILMKHCSNSAGIVELPQANMDAVRAGITLYGLWPSAQVRRDIVSLRPVMSLYSRIVYIKEIEAGTQVSYGGTFTAQSKRKVATVPVGYGDGYPRGLSGKGFVLIRGQKAPVLGRVCMDQFMVDVTHIPEAASGDVVTLIGRDGSEQITMEQLGELSGRFNYEFACGIGKRVPRVYVKEGKVLYTRDNYQDF